MTMSRGAGREKARTRFAETAISTRDLRKTHDGVVAADGVDLEVGRGEILGLLGPERAGKATMLEVISGREKPDAGVIEVAGRVAVRPRDAALFGYLSLHEILALFADLHDEGYFPTRIRGLLERVSLRDRAGFTLEALSRDEKQRFYLALALVGEPEIILLDEPTAGLDRTARREAWGMVRGMREAGATVVLATRDAEEAGELCDRVALMERGRIVASGGPLPSVGGLEATVAENVDGERTMCGTRSPRATATRLADASEDSEASLAAYHAGRTQLESREGVSESLWGKGRKRVHSRRP